MKRVILVVLAVIALIVIIFAAIRLSLKKSPPFAEVNIPDGEYLHYGNYFDGQKYADLYVVTTKEQNEKGGYYYHSYIDLINTADNRKPAVDYTTWPSYCISDPKYGSTVESVAVLAPNVLNNWLRFDGLTYWKISMDYEAHQGSYLLKYSKNGVDSELKGDFKNVKNIPSSCFWATLCLQSRFVDYIDGGLIATINPIYLPLQAKYTYELKGEEMMNTAAGSFTVKKYETSVFKNILSTPETLGLVFKMMKEVGERKPQGPFAIYVEKGERHLTVKMENTSGLGGDYILEEVGTIHSMAGNE